PSSHPSAGHPGLSLLLRPSRAHRDLHSFPTRRSSDLPIAVGWRLGILRIIVALLLYILPFVGQTAAKAAHTQIFGHIVQIEVREDRKSTRLNSSHVKISYAVFCLKKKSRGSVV